MIANKGKSLKILLMIAVILITLGTISYATGETKITGLKVSQMDRERVTLQWDGIKNIAGYEVYINMDNSEYKYLGDARTNTITLVGVQAGKTYGIKVRAYTSSRGVRTYLTEFSDELKVSTAALGMEEQSKELGKVENIKVDIDEESARASLSWDRVTNAMGYEVWINAAGNGYVYLGSCVNNNVNVTNFTRGIEYIIKIRAFKTEEGVKVYAEKYSEEVKVFIEAKEEEIPIPDRPGEGDWDNSNPTYPDKVTGLTVSMSKNIATFKWDKMPGALGYEVNITTPQYANLSRITATNTLKVSGFNVAGYTYKVKVRAYKLDAKNNKLYGDYSDEVMFECEEEKITNPNKVTGLTVSMNRDAATFYWNKMSNAAGYQICITIPFVGDVTRFVTINTATVTGFTDEKDEYVAKVRAYTLKNTGEKVYGEFSEEVKFRYEDTVTKPAKVTGVTVKVSGSSATVNWNKVSDAFGYEIVVDKSISSGNIDVRNVTGYTIKNLSYRAEGYTVKVVAYKLNGNSQKVYGDYSDVTKFNVAKPAETTPSTPSKPSTPTTPTTPTTPPVTKPAKVTGLKAKVTNNMATLMWNAVSGAKGYEIYYAKMHTSTTPSNAYTKTTTGTKYSIDDLVVNTYGYTAKVRAYKLDSKNNKVYGEYSETIKFSRIPTVNGVKVELSGTMAIINWNRIAGVDGYEVILTQPSGAGKTYSSGSNGLRIGAAIYASTGNYSIKVRAYKLNSSNGKDYGAYSTSVSVKGTIPKQVTGLKQIADSPSGCDRISWNKVEGNNIKYEVYAEDANGHMVMKSLISGTAEVMANRTAHTVKVRAYITENGKTTYGAWSTILTLK